MPSKPPPIPLYRPSRYIHFSSAHGRCTTGVLLVDVSARSPLAACTWQVIWPSQVFSDVIYAQWWEICPATAELFGRRTRFFHGLGSSTRSSTFIARVHYSCTSVYLITWTVYLRILRIRHYDVMVGCSFTGQGKKGDNCVGKKVNGGPVLQSLQVCRAAHPS